MTPAVVNNSGTDILPAPKSSRTIHALGLFSGGLDSLLATCLMHSQGIQVQAVTFDSPFFDTYRARQAAQRLNIPLHIVDFGPELVTIINSPRHGFGSQINPCIDCHIAMLKRSGEMLEPLGCDFIFTGEVLNQRPMSQNRKALETIARQSGYQSLILRPLSAALLEPTAPERRGWIVRQRMGSIDGRSRHAQLQMAAGYGITNIPPVAGGCRLTEPNFARRLSDLRDHEGLHGMRAIQLLKIGRHVRISKKTKLIVGRNERDNVELEGSAELYDYLLKPEGVPGPTGLLPITVRDDELRLAAAVCARYSDAQPEQAVRIRIRSSQGIKHLETRPAAPDIVAPLLI